MEELLSINIQGNDKNTYNAPVSLSYGKLKDAIEWCERNCSGAWQFDEYSKIGSSVNMYNLGSNYIKKGNNYIFIFNDERDYVAFTVFYS